MEYDLGLRLRDLRDKHHLTQEQVGKRIGVSGANISGYENNTISPPADIIKKLALLFGVTTDYLLGLEDRQPFIIDTKTEYQERTVQQIMKLIQDLIK